MYRLDASMRPLVDKVRNEDILLYAGGEYPALRTSLDYYYGKHTVVVDPLELRKNIQQYMKQWSDVYVLSDSNTLPGLAYLGNIDLVRDSYSRGTKFNQIPKHPMMENKHYSLYRAIPSEFNLLHEDDIIDFSSKGNANQYLGTGWSGQEMSYRWTEGNTANLELPFAESSSEIALRFELHSLNCSAVSVKVNGIFRTKWTFPDCADLQEKNVVLNKDDLKDQKVTISFDMPNVVSPHDLNPASGDQRKLGMYVTKMAVEKTTSGKILERHISKFFTMLEQGFNFSSNDFPPVLSTAGISGAEAWGRWTDGSIANIKFSHPLPLKFDLVVTGGAYGPNIGRPIKFKVGSQTKEMVFTSGPIEHPQTIHAEFALENSADTIEISVPMPTKPNNDDRRQLGIGLVDLKINQKD